MHARHERLTLRKLPTWSHHTTCLLWCQYSGIVSDVTRKQFDKRIGKTQLSKLLEILLKKNLIYAESVDLYYKEIYLMIRETEEKKERKIKRFLKKQGLNPDLK